MNVQKSANWENSGNLDAENTYQNKYQQQLQQTQHHQTQPKQVQTPVSGSPQNQNVINNHQVVRKMYSMGGQQQHHHAQQHQQPVRQYHHQQQFGQQRYNRYITH